MSNKSVELPTIKKIEEYLGQMGWVHDPVTDSVIRTRYHGQFGAVKVMIHALEKGVLLSINPVLAKPEQGWEPSVDRLIQALTQEIHLIRVGMDNERDIFVKVDLPLEQLGFEEFVYVLLNLCQVADQLLVPILQAQAYDTHIRYSQPEISQL